MPEVTDSFCERCGSRYIFNAGAPKGLSLKGARVLARGLKNFVLTDGQSMSDSIALARHEDDHEDSSRVTEAFHKTFNFCMTCRQYACDRCWNEKTGACLSCTPELGQDVATPREMMPQQREPIIPAQEPAGQPEPLFAQPAAADWEADWSLFAESASAEAEIGRPAPAGFNEPIKLPEPTAPKPQKPVAQPEWPVADLPKGVPAKSSGSNGKTGHRTARKQADLDAASLWPLADQIAPEMTLTPEELDIVETRLGQAEPTAEHAAEPMVAAQSQPEVVAEAEVVAEPTAEHAAEPMVAAQSQPEIVAEPEIPVAASVPWVADEPAYAADHFVLAEPAQPEQAAEWGASWRTASPSSWEMQPVSGQNRAPASTPTYATDPNELQSAAELEPIAPAEQPAATQHLLSMSMPSLAEVGPAPKKQEHAPLVSRLLGRKSSSRHDQTDAEAWPHVTKWTDRPIKNADWIDEALAARAAQADLADRSAPEPEFVAPIRPFFSRNPELDPESAQMPTLGHGSATLPVQNIQEAVDARSAAAVRLSAVNGASKPSADPATPVQPEAPAWPEADRQVVEAATRRRGKAPEQVPEAAQPPTPVAPPPIPVQPAQAQPTSIPPVPVARPAAPPAWPPLGASWPAAQDANAPWPGPETAPVAPAAMAASAAQAVREPTLAEMWDQSSQEVLNHGSVRVCTQCALPVSTQARFCRRCGTRQS